MSPILNPTSSSPRAWHVLRSVLAGALVLGLVGCDESGPTRPRESQGVAGGGTGSSAVNTSLIGTWERVFLFTDEFGFAHATETTWQFREGGTAVRTVVTRNLTLGASDVVVTTAQWTIDGTDVVLQFDPPDSGQVILEFRIVGNELTLAGEVYTRVADGCC